jgi:hypothetical protein
MTPDDFPQFDDPGLVGNGRLAYRSECGMCGACAGVNIDCEGCTERREGWAEARNEIVRHLRRPNKDGTPCSDEREALAARIERRQL